MAKSLRGCPLSLTGLHVPNADTKGYPCACGWTPTKRILAQLVDAQRRYVRETRDARGLALLRLAPVQPALAMQLAAF